MLNDIQFNVKTYGYAYLCAKISYIRSHFDRLELVRHTPTILLFL